MVQYELNYEDKNTGYEEAVFYDLNEALSFIKSKGDNITFYNLWEVTLKILKRSADEKND